MGTSRHQNDDGIPKEDPTRGTDTRVVHPSQVLSCEDPSSGVWYSRLPIYTVERTGIQPVQDVVEVQRVSPLTKLFCVK